MHLNVKIKNHGLGQYGAEPPLFYVTILATLCIKGLSADHISNMSKQLATRSIPPSPTPWRPLLRLTASVDVALHARTCCSPPVTTLCRARHQCAVSEIQEPYSRPYYGGGEDEDVLNEPLISGSRSPLRTVASLDSPPLSPPFLRCPPYLSSALPSQAGPEHLNELNAVLT